MLDITIVAGTHDTPVKKPYKKQKLQILYHGIGIPIGD